MCTELFLALLYFITIVIVNYFLYKLLINYYSKILYLLKVKNILNNFKKSKLSVFSTFYNYSKNQSKFSLKLFSTLSSANDIFLIGNTYKYLAESLKNQNTLDLPTLYYLQLLENQYLSKTIRLK